MTRALVRILAAVIVLAVCGCRNGPAIDLSIDLQQGPRLQIGFRALPLSNVAPRAVSGPPLAN